MEYSAPPIYCTHDDLEVEHCDGKWSDWMHTATRRERCPNGRTVATPQTAAQVRK